MGQIASDRARRGPVRKSPARVGFIGSRIAIRLPWSERTGGPQAVPSVPIATSAQLHYEPRGPVIRAPVQFQPGSMPAFLIARTASGEVRNFRSAVAPAGFLAWLCTPPENTVISCISSDRGPR